MQNTRPEATGEERPKLQLSAVQVIAAVLASITSAVILSKFGVAGTYVGTAIGSAVSTVGVAFYSLTMRQAHRRVQRYAHLRHESPTQAPPGGSTKTDAPAIKTPPAAWSSRHPAPAPRPAERPLPPRRAGRLQEWFASLPLSGRVVVTAAATFLLAVTAIVLFQFLSGHSLTNVWGIGRSSNGPNAGCVVGSCGGAVETPAPAATAPPSTQPSTAATPVATPTAAPAGVPSSAPTVAASPATGESPGPGATHSSP